MIKNLVASLPEVGKIKIGIKGKMVTSGGGKEFQPPQKLDHFLITTLERGSDGNFIRNSKAHEEIGEKPKSLPVRLIYNDMNLNFLTRLACYNGRSLFCSGDNEAASRRKGADFEAVRCPCNLLEPGSKPQCKPSGILSCIIDAHSIVGGVWKLRTTSWNTVKNLMGGLALIERISGGYVAGLPLRLVFQKKTTTIPGTDKLTTIPTVGIIYQGTMPALATAGAQAAQLQAESQKRIEYIEDIARAEVLKDVQLLTEGETVSDVIEEFFPEEAGGKLVDEPGQEEGGDPVEDKDQGDIYGGAAGPAPGVEEGSVSDPRVKCTHMFGEPGAWVDAINPSSGICEMCGRTVKDPDRDLVPPKKTEEALPTAGEFDPVKTSLDFNALCARKEFADTDGYQWLQYVVANDETFAGEMDARVWALQNQAEFEIDFKKWLLEREQLPTGGQAPTEAETAGAEVDDSAPIDLVGNPESADENWWNAPKNWVNRRAESIRHIVRIGFGYEAPAVEKDTKGAPTQKVWDKILEESGQAFGMLDESLPEVCLMVRKKFVKAYGLAEWNEMVRWSTSDADGQPAPGGQQGSEATETTDETTQEDAGGTEGLDPTLMSLEDLVAQNEAFKVDDTTTAIYNLTFKELGQVENEQQAIAFGFHLRTFKDALGQCFARKDKGNEEALAAAKAKVPQINSLESAKAFVATYDAIEAEQAAGAADSLM